MKQSTLIIIIINLLIGIALVVSYFFLFTMPTSDEDWTLSISYEDDEILDIHIDDFRLLANWEVSYPLEGSETIDDTHCRTTDRLFRCAN